MDVKEIANGSREMAVTFGWQVPRMVGKGALSAVRYGAEKTRHTAKSALKNVGVLSLDPADIADRLKISESVITDNMPPRTPKDVAVGYLAMWRRPAEDKDRSENRVRTGGGRIFSYVRWYEETMAQKMPGIDMDGVRIFTREARRMLLETLKDGTTDAKGIDIGPTWDGISSPHRIDDNGPPIAPVLDINPK